MVNCSVNRWTREGLVCAVALVLLVASCGRKTEKAEPPAQRVESTSNVSISSYATAPDVELKALDGTSVRLSSFHGKIVILSFMATWNKECASQFRTLGELQAKLQRYQFAVLGVVTDKDGKAALESFLTKNPLSYPVYYNGGEIVSQFGGLRKLPTTYILLRDGSIYSKEIGPRSMRVLDEKLKEIIRQRL